MRVRLSVVRRTPPSPAPSGGGEGAGRGRVWPGATRPRRSADRQAEEEGPGRGGPDMLTHGTSSKLWSR